MAASSCTLAKGVKFFISTDSGSNYTELVDVIELGESPTNTRPKIDKTPLNPDGGREYSFGIPDPGMQTFKQLWSKTREATLRTNEGVANYWKTLYNDATLDANKSKEVITGTLTKVSKEALSSADSRLVLSCEITLSGSPTFTAGS